MKDLADGYVAALERHNRLLRRLTAACAELSAVAAACVAQAVLEPHVAHEAFVLKDRNGTHRFEMVVDKTDGKESGLHIVDANGQTRIDMGITAQGEPVIVFLDGNGKAFRKLP